MSEAETSPPRSPDTGDRRVTDIIDRATFVDHLGPRFALGALQREGDLPGNEELGAVVRIEGNVFLALTNAKTYVEAQPQLRTMVFPGDLPYLRRRAVETPNRTARARYLLAVASISRRKDDGEAAADAYLDAIASYLAPTAQEHGEALHALIGLFPIARVLSRRYARGSRFVEAVQTFINDPSSKLAQAKAAILADVVSDRGMKKEDLAQLRAASLTLLADMASGHESALQRLAEVGRKLADRLGEQYTAWYEAEATSLERRLELGVPPLMVGPVGTRLLYLYNRLGDRENLRATRERMRAARRQETYETISLTEQGWQDEVRQLRDVGAQLAREVGPDAALAYLATAEGFIPQLTDVENHMKQLEADGVGVFSHLATPMHVFGERHLSADHLDFEEQYDLHWRWLAVYRFAAIFSELCQAGEVTIDRLAAFFASSWIGTNEHIPYGGDEEMPNDLVALLCAPVRAFIDVICEGTHPDQIVPATDSLTLRMEAVFRKFARMLGELDTTTNDRGVTQVTGLKALLDNSVVAEKLGIDLLTFAKHSLLKEPEGMRHRVGHALLHRGQYDLAHMFALLLLLLRLRALDVPETLG